MLTNEDQVTGIDTHWAMPVLDSTGIPDSALSGPPPPEGGPTLIGAPQFR
jgi:hypothetical protein